MKKIISAFIVGILLVTTSVAGYATISFVLNKVIDSSATVGDTVIYTDGLIIELQSYDNHTLTYFEIEETDTSRHYITYIYSYEILVEGMDINVSSLSNDIIVTNISNDASTISITFSLNQEHEFNNGDVLNIQFYFEAVEAVEQSFAGFTASNPININTATKDQLMEIGLSDFEASMTIEARNVYTLTSVSDWEAKTSLSGFVSSYQQYADIGIIVFE